VVAEGFLPELSWQQRQSLNRLTETQFLRETAWVILAGGMRETVVRKLFPAVTTGFFEFESASTIVASQSDCRRNALAVFRHPAKIDAVIRVAGLVHDATFSVVRRCLKTFGVGYLQAFPYIGPVTKFHLAKNLGIDTAKPDRHLVRLAITAGAKDVFSLCRSISALSGDRVAVVDLVLWRFCTLKPDYRRLFARVATGCATAQR
jgi:hypothetical protein